MQIEIIQAGYTKAEEVKNQCCMSDVWTVDPLDE